MAAQGILNAKALVDKTVTKEKLSDDLWQKIEEAGGGSQAVAGNSRRLYLHLENDACNFFVGEKLKVIRVQSNNLNSLKVQYTDDANQPVELDLPLRQSIDVDLPFDKVITFVSEKTLTDPIAYALVYMDADLDFDPDA